MAIAGRSYTNVATIIRGSLEDTDDFISKPQVHVVSTQPTATQLSGSRTTILRNTLQDPPVLTTVGPVVVARPSDPKWFATKPPTILSNPQPAAPVALATPGPVVVNAPNDRRWFNINPPQVIDNLQLGTIPISAPTPSPVVIASPVDRRWFNTNPTQVIDNVQLGTIPVFAATPDPIVVSSSRPSQFQFKQALIVRNPLPSIVSPVRHPLNLSGTLTDENKLSGTVAEVIYNGTVTVVTIGGTLVRATTVVNGTVVGWTMQEVDITLAEFNDETLDLTLLTSGGGALNITGMELDMFLKSAAGTPDASATKLSTVTGEIVITNPTGGLATVAIPASDLGAGNGYGFYRVDTVNGGFRNTAIFGKVAVTPL
jgi:hypothetical protein